MLDEELRLFLAREAGVGEDERLHPGSLERIALVLANAAVLHEDDPAFATGAFEPDLIRFVLGEDIVVHDDLVPFCSECVRDLTATEAAVDEEGHAARRPSCTPYCRTASISSGSRPKSDATTLAESPALIRSATSSTRTPARASRG